MCNCSLSRRWPLKARVSVGCRLNVEKMPWVCRLCTAFLTYRRDRVCQSCKPVNRRGRHHLKHLKVRLRGKTSPSSLSNRQYGFVVTKAPVPAADKTQWSHALEGEWKTLRDQFSLSAAHSVLSHSHSLLEGMVDQGRNLPLLTDSSLLGLIFCSMSLSSRLVDPDEVKPKLLRLKNKTATHHVTMKSVIHAQCTWVNHMYSLDVRLLD